MSIVPVGDIDILAMTPQQFFQLMEEDRPTSRRMTQSGWGPGQSSLPAVRPKPDPIFPVNPFDTVDRSNEWLKHNTYVDMFGWKDAILDGRTAIKQVMLLGIMGDAYLTKNRAGKEVVIFKGHAGLREKLPGTRYLRDNPVVHAADLVIGHKEMLKEAGKATRIAIVCFIAWDIVHECLQDKPDMTYLGVSILSDIFQAVAATYTGVLAGVIAVTVGAPVVLAFCVVVGGTFVAGMGIAAADAHFGLTTKAVEIAKNIEGSEIVSELASFANKINKLYVDAHASPLSYILY